MTEEERRFPTGQRWTERPFLIPSLHPFSPFSQSLHTPAHLFSHYLLPLNPFLDTSLNLCRLVFFPSSPTHSPLIFLTYDLYLPLFLSCLLSIYLSYLVSGGMFDGFSESGLLSWSTVGSVAFALQQHNMSSYILVGFHSKHKLANLIKIIGCLISRVRFVTTRAGVKTYRKPSSLRTQIDIKV